MNDLSHLTDEELKEYFSLYKGMIKESGRAEGVKINTFDLKFAYHIVRLLSECEQIFKEGDLDLQEKGRREHMKAIRRGEISEAEIREWASNKEKQLEELYHKSTLPDAPDRKAIRDLLLKCLEHHYGSLDKYIQQPDWSVAALKEIKSVLEKYQVNLYSA
jgi:hypothetical protein